LKRSKKVVSPRPKLFGEETGEEPKKRREGIELEAGTHGL
jgi:hypothetical protein